MLVQIVFVSFMFIRFLLFYIILMILRFFFYSNDSLPLTKHHIRD